MSYLVCHCFRWPLLAAATENGKTLSTRGKCITYRSQGIANENEISSPHTKFPWKHLIRAYLNNIFCLRLNFYYASLGHKLLYSIKARLAAMRQKSRFPIEYSL